MANYPTEFATELNVLSPNDLGALGAQTVTGLAERGFVVSTGVTEHQAGSIAMIAIQPHVVEYCPNDGTNRFATKSMFGKWLGKGGGRGMVVISDVPGHEGPLSAADLRALDESDVRTMLYGWSGVGTNKHIPGADITTAFRSHEAMVGKGLGSALTRMVVVSAAEIFESDPKQISLETWGSNQKAIAAYIRNGFNLIAVSDPEARPTLEEPGTLINGNEVYHSLVGGKPGNFVQDQRNHMLLDSDFYGYAA